MASQELAELYSRAAPIYAEKGPPYFAYAGRRLVELAEVQPGDTVLDLATGRGAVLLPAAERVGSPGRAIGIDIAPGMLEHTRRALDDGGLSQAEVLEMDACSELAFPPHAFSHVLCSFAVFFFPDLPSVLAEVRRVLRPNGVAGFAFSRGTDPRWEWYEALLRSRGALQQRAGVGSISVRQPSVLVTLLGQAGFVDIRDQEESVELFYASPEAWWDSPWAHGSRRPLERLDPDKLASIKAECLTRVGQMVEPKGVPERVTLAFVLARRPSS